MDFDEIQRMSLPELRAYVDQVAAKYGLAAQKGTAMDEAEHQRQMEHLRALEAHQKALNTRLGAFLSIALLCKRALEAPPHSTLHQMYVLDIARICKRWLNPPENLTH